MMNMSKVYKEINEILKYIPKEYIERIPPQLLEVIEQNMDENYEYKVEHIRDFENQKMLNETRALLAVIYRDYLASDEEREIIKNEEREFFEKERENNRLEKVLNKRRINRDNDLSKEQEKLVEQKLENVQLTKYEEKKWYQKIIEFIKKIKITKEKGE